MGWKPIEASLPGLLRSCRGVKPVVAEGKGIEEGGGEEVRFRSRGSCARVGEVSFRMLGKAAGEE